MEQFNSKIPVANENVKKRQTSTESRQPLNTLLDLDPNLLHSSNTRFVTVSENETTDNIVNDATSKEATPSKLPRVSSDSTDISTYENDVLTYLLEKEEKMPCLFFCEFLKYRAYALNLITNLHEKNDDPAVIQTAAWYFDTLLSEKRVTKDQILIVTTACFWIGQKIHGHACGAQQLIEITGNRFNAAELFSTEKKILLSLKFPPQPVVPQEFLGFLVSCCDSEQEKKMIYYCATFICLNFIKVNIDFSNEYPSVVAVAATKITLLLLKKQNLAKKLEACFMYSTSCAKGDVIEVCMGQIHALKTFFSDKFKFTAQKRILKDCYYLLNDLKREINMLYSTGEVSKIREILLK